MERDEVDRTIRSPHAQSRRASDRELFQAEQRARQVAERAAGRADRLQSLSAALSEAVTADQVAAIAMNQGLATLGAKAGWVLFCTRDASSLELACSIGRPPELNGDHNSLRIDAPSPSADAFRRMKMVAIESDDALKMRYPEELAAAWPESGGRSYAAVPLVVGGRALGAIGLCFDRPHSFSEEERAFMISVARQCAQALERSHLYDSERVARAESESSERKYRFLAEAMPQLVWTAEPDGSMDYVNRRWLEYTGYANDQIAGWKWKRVVHPDHLTRCLERWSRALSTGEVFEMEYRLRRVDGSYRWHLARASPLKDENERILKWFGTCTDIDDQKRTEDAIRFLATASEVLASSLDFEKTLSAMAELAVPRFADGCAIDLVEPGPTLQRIATVHTDPKKATVSREMAVRFPPKADDPTGICKVIRTGLPELAADVTESLLTTVAQDPEHLRLLKELDLRSYMVVPLRANQRVVGTMTFSSSESGRRFSAADLSLVEDLARRASLAIENSRLFTAAQEAIRARDDFLSIASHELRTPLSALQLQILSLLRSAQSSPTPLAPKWVAGRVLKSKTQVERLVRLIENLLDVTRITAGKVQLKLEAVDFADVIRETLERLKDQIGASPVQLRLESPVTGVWDRLRLEQVITNLISNAIKYGDGKGMEIDLRASILTAVLEVTDHGIGISTEHQDRIFKRFERAVSDRHYGGFGLGLWITSQIVERLGGRISVRSESLRGSTFIVELPRQRPQDPA